MDDPLGQWHFSSPLRFEQFLELGIDAVVHGPELQYRECAPLVAHALLAEQNRARTGEAHHDRDEDQERGREDDEEARPQDDVDRPLDERLASAEPRRLDVDEGQTGDRADVQAWPCDVDDARGEHQVLIAGPKQPGDLLHLLWRQVVGTGDRDGIGTRHRHRPVHVVDGAQDGDTTRQGSHSAVGDARPHHQVAG